jgi:hypothetical protein
MVRRDFGVSALNQGWVRRGHRDQAMDWLSMICELWTLLIVARPLVGWN